MYIEKAVVCLLISSAALCAQVNGIVSSATFAVGPVAAGSYASAFGTFPGATTSTTPSATLPKTLGGVTLTIDSIDAPLHFVSAGQINFLVPASTASGTHNVSVKVPGGTVTGSINVISAAPGVFPLDTATPPRGAIQNQDNITVNSPSAPAHRGEVIVIYGTGPGAFNLPVQDGLPPGATPLFTTKSTPQVFIAGVEAEVKFSGLNPFVAGLWQLNVSIPNQSFISGRVPVSIFVDGVSANEVTVFVQ